MPVNPAIHRFLIIASPGAERSRLRRELEKAGYVVEEGDLGFDGIAAVMSLLPDAVVMQPPEGVLGSAYLAQFRFADYTGPLVVVGAEQLRASLKGAPGPVFFVPDCKDVLEAVQRLPEALRANAWHAA